VLRAVEAQRQARGGSDVRADIEESPSLEVAAEPVPLELGDGARQEGAIVGTVDEGAARDFPVGCAHVEAQAVGVDGHRRGDVAQRVEDVAAADGSALASEVKHPAGEVGGGAPPQGCHG